MTECAFEATGRSSTTRRLMRCTVRFYVVHFEAEFTAPCRSHSRFAEFPRVHWEKLRHSVYRLRRMHDVLPGSSRVYIRLGSQRAICGNITKRTAPNTIASQKGTTPLNMVISGTSLATPATT
jgi:hypothetical protein